MMSWRKKECTVL